MFPFKQLSIATKIVSVAAFLAAIFLLSSVGYIVLNVRDVLSQSTTDFLELQVQNESSRIEEDLDDISSIVTFLSQTPPIQGFFRAKDNDGFDEEQNSTTEQWKQRFQTILVAEMGASRVFNQLRYIDETGQEIVRVNREDGQIIVVSDSDLQDKSTRTYFKEASQLKEGDIYVSKVELNKEGEPARVDIPYNPVIRYAVPVFDIRTNKLRGIVIGNVSYERLIAEDILSGNQSSNIYILDEDGFFLTAPDPTLLWGGQNNLGTNISAQNYREVFTTIMRTADANTLSIEGAIYSYARISVQGDRYWTVVREVPTSVLFRDVQLLSESVAIVAVGVFIILFFIFLFSIKRVLKPLRQLEEAAQQIGEGNFDQKVPVRSNDEVGSLANSVNIMATKLKDIYGKLEQKIAERTRQLSEQKARLEALIPRFPLGILVEDENRKIVIVNSRFTEILGSTHTPDTLVGADTRLATDALKDSVEDYDTYMKRIEEVVSAGKEVIDEKIELREDVYILRSYVPLFDKGTFRGGLWTYQDISDAEKISNMKTDFVSMVSHQLKTPVAQIKGFVSNMLDGLTGELTSEQREYLTFIDNVATKNGKLIDALLDVSRIERGVIKFNTETVDANELLADVITAQQTFAKEHEVELIMQESPTTVPIAVDVQKISEALNNIVNNAIKFSPKGSTVETAVVVKDERAHFVVTDHGPGIDPDVQKELFEKERVWSGKVQASGAGLGLYLSKKFVMLQSGTIQFVTADTGTTFTISFPLTQ